MWHKPIPFSMFGWRIWQNERLIYRANSGNPEIRLKFHHFPEYRQRVVVERPPQGFRLKRKGHNAFYMMNRMLPAKGSISLERVVKVFPEEKHIGGALGRISDIPEDERKRYSQASRYWPLKDEILTGDWFEEDDMGKWLKKAWRFERERIVPENQERRWGAREAMERGIGDCDEFTDLFITLARKRGIPSRRITGIYVRRDGSHERHAWAEALSTAQGWLTVDMALNNIGQHTRNYILLKVEEFNPALPDYQVEFRHSSKVHYEWDMGEMKIEEVEEEFEE